MRYSNYVDFTKFVSGAFKTWIILVQKNDDVFSSAFQL